MLRRISLAGESRHLQYFESFGNRSYKDILTYAREISPNTHMTNILSEKFIGVINLRVQIFIFDFG